MFSHFLLALCATSSCALAAVLPRQDASLPDTGQNVPIPVTAKGPGSFSTGAAAIGLPAADLSTVPAIYGPRDIDLPFGRMYKGTLNFYKTVNDPTTNFGTFGSQYDNANQSACGIPSNAYFQSGVGIHPYFLKYAGLDRE